MFDRLPYKLQQPLIRVSILGYTPDLDPSTRGALVATSALAATASISVIINNGFSTPTPTLGPLAIVFPSNGATANGATVSGSATVSVTSKLSVNNDWWNSLAVDGVFDPLE